MNVEEKVAWLASEWKGLVEIRYDGFHVDCPWGIHVSMGNSMRYVSGTNDARLEGAVDKAIEKWNKRSPEEPFTL
jgi:hypothetical protein